MGELRERMIRALRLAGLEEGTQQAYLRAVRQLTAYYMVAPDQLSERQVEDYILYVRDELAVAKGTFQPMFFGLKFFYVQTLGYEWLEKAKTYVPKVIVNTRVASTAGHRIPDG